MRGVVRTRFVVQHVRAALRAGQFDDRTVQNGQRATRDVRAICFDVRRRPAGQIVDQVDVVEHDDVDVGDALLDVEHFGAGDRADDLRARNLPGVRREIAVVALDIDLRAVRAIVMIREVRVDHYARLALGFVILVDVAVGHGIRDHLTRNAARRTPDALEHDIRIFHVDLGLGHGNLPVDLDEDGARRAVEVDRVGVGNVPVAGGGFKSAELRVDAHEKPDELLRGRAGIGRFRADDHQVVLAPDDLDGGRRHDVGIVHIDDLNLAAGLDFQPDAEDIPGLGQDLAELAGERDIADLSKQMVDADVAVDLHVRIAAVDAPLGALQVVAYAVAVVVDEVIRVGQAARAGAEVRNRPVREERGVANVDVVIHVRIERCVVHEPRVVIVRCTDVEQRRNPDKVRIERFGLNELAGGGVVVIVNAALFKVELAFVSRVVRGTVEVVAAKPQTIGHLVAVMNRTRFRACIAFARVVHAAERARRGPDLRKRRIVAERVPIFADLDVTVAVRILQDRVPFDNGVDVNLHAIDDVICACKRGFVHATDRREHDVAVVGVPDAVLLEVELARRGVLINGVIVVCGIQPAVAARKQHAARNGEAARGVVHLVFGFAFRQAQNDVVIVAAQRIVRVVFIARDRDVVVYVDGEPACVYVHGLTGISAAARDMLRIDQLHRMRRVGQNRRHTGGGLRIHGVSFTLVGVITVVVDVIESAVALVHEELVGVICASAAVLDLYDVCRDIRRADRLQHRMEDVVRVYGKFQLIPVAAGLRVVHPRNLVFFVPAGERRVFVAGRHGDERFLRFVGEHFAVHHVIRCGEQIIGIPAAVIQRAGIPVKHIARAFVDGDKVSRIRFRRLDERAGNVEIVLAVLEVVERLYGGFVVVEPNGIAARADRYGFAADGQAAQRDHGVIDREVADLDGAAHLRRDRGAADSPSALLAAGVIRILRAGSGVVVRGMQPAGSARDSQHGAVHRLHPREIDDRREAAALERIEEPVLLEIDTAAGILKQFKRRRTAQRQRGCRSEPRKHARVRHRRQVAVIQNVVTAGTR
ncbi:hypothetical protein SDC9_65800 [bioreactor metagenome]|uniref:Uncharacterized protein n=1 Tax=bioreactor metagenome TaxID=1076179 RepID=A0A644XTY2_9ZZZZ